MTIRRDEENVITGVRTQNLVVVEHLGDIHAHLLYCQG